MTILVFGPSRLQQVPEHRLRHGDAAGGRCKAGPGDMDEDGAAAAGDARSAIVVDLDDHVVEGVAAAKAIA